MCDGLGERREQASKALQVLSEVTGRLEQQKKKGEKLNEDDIKRMMELFHVLDEFVAVELEYVKKCSFRMAEQFEARGDYATARELRDPLAGTGYNDYTSMRKGNK